MHFFLFILLGIVDVVALFALMFKAFRFPFLEYKSEIFILSVVISVLSYFLRVFFDINPILDIISHFFIYLIFLWLIIKVKPWIAFIVSMMYFIYGGISTASYFFYVTTGILTPEMVENSNSYSGFLIQLSQQTVSLLIAYALYRFDFGIAFFVRPPHNFTAKTKVKKNQLVMIYLVIVLAITCFVGYYFAYKTKNMLIIPPNLIIIGVILFLAYRRDRANGRPV